MGLERDLIDTIKMHFARKSSAQLQEIVQADNQERWSLEAQAAANEVLQDRRIGRAQEPQVAEEERQPLPSPSIPYSLGFLVGFLPIFALNGLRFGSEFTQEGDNPDVPVPFGPKMAWLALETTDTEAVAAALDVRETRTATWAEGIEAACQTSVFVTPPLGDWTLAVSTILFPPERPATFVKPLLEQLSRPFGDAQYFCTHRDVELHVWARARKGRLIRGYGWLGEKRLILWDEGTPTKEEYFLGLRFLDGHSAVVEPAQTRDAPLPNEAGVMQLASFWSFDPTTLDSSFKEPVMGLVGQVGWAQNRPERGRS